MLAKRIIPCLDIKDGQTVKGTRFVNLRHAGDPVEMAGIYSEMGADELVFLDIAATYEQRKTFAALVEKVASHVSIPFTVGGGISEIDDISRLLDAGADKVSINSAALFNPSLIDQVASRYGSQVLVLAIDAQMVDGQWKCFVKGGREETSRELLEWAKEGQERGAGEVLFTSMDHDGVRTGYPVEALRSLSDNLDIPVIASGGAGKMEDFLEVFQKAHVDAALAAGVFHFGDVKIPELKAYLKENGIPVRI